MINGVILKKLQTLDEMLNELGSLGKVTTGELNKDWRTRRAIERNLQMMMAIVINVCQGSVPQPIVDFHNLFVCHCYERINANTLANFVNNHLDDFRRFRNEVLTPE